MRYAAPHGLRSLVADLADGLDVRTGIRVSEVRGSRPGFGRASVDGDDFDAVVLAMPDPQAARLLCDDLIEEKEAVADRTWEPVLALLAVFHDRTWPAFDGGFVQDDEVLSFLADDGRRRGDDAPVLVAHSTGSWAARHLDDPQAGTEELAEALDRLIGCGDPSASRVQRWTFARPAASREQLCWFGGQRIGFAGDGWGSPKVETAWTSGTMLGRRLVTELT
jgi:predicted NAD/FAD-dependent oxidoreductase